MAARLQGTFYSYNKGPGTGSGSRNTYVVRIDDDDFSGTATALELRGLQFEWKGQDETLFNPILTSACTLTLYVNTEDTQNFVLDLNDAPERRFKVYITKNGIRDWVGYIVTDLVNIDDRPLEMGYEFKVQAVDGLALLKTIDFSDAGSPYTGKATLLELLYLCLGKVGLESYFSTGLIAAYVYIQSTWFASQHATKANTTNMFPVTRINHRVWRKIDDKGNVVYQKTYDVLTQLLQAFGLRLHFSVGYYWVQEIANYAASGNVRWQAYDKLQAAAVGANISLSSMDQITDTTGDVSSWDATTTPILVLSGGEETFFPPLASSSVLYKHYSTQNLIAGIQWSSALVSDQVLEDLDHNSGATRLAFSFSITSRISDSAITDYTAMTPTWLQFNIKISINTGSTTYYLRRLATFAAGAVTYSDIEWTTASTDRYQFWVGPQTYDNTQLTAQVALITPPLPASGDVSINVIYNAGATLAGVLGASGTRTITYATASAYLEAFTDGNIEDQFNYTSYESVNSVTASATDDIELLLGDGPTTNAYGCLEVYNGTVWSKSSGWGRLIDGTYTLAHGKLLTRERLALQDTNVRRLRARFIGNYAPYHLLRRGYDNSTYMLQGARLNAAAEQWEGTWAQIGYSTATITTNDEQEYITDPSFGVGRDRNAPPGVLSGNPARSGLFGVLYADRYDGGVNRQNSIRSGLDTSITEFTPLVLTTALVAGATITSLVYEATLYNAVAPLQNLILYKNDQVIVIHPITGQWQVFTISATSLSNFATVTSATALYNFPAGSYLRLSAFYFQRSTQDIWRARWEQVTLFGRTATVTTGVSEQFIVVGLHKLFTTVSFSFVTFGTGTLTLVVKKNGTTTVLATVATTAGGFITAGFAASYVDCATYDIITFEITAITGTAPTGMALICGFV